jgi:hypothetical protein
MDATACNYNPDVTEDDNSCEYPAEGFDCEGNCLEGTTTSINVREISTGGFDYSLTQYGGSWSFINTATGESVASTATDDLSECLVDGCYEISGISGSGGSYAFAYSIDGGELVTPGSFGETGTDFISIGEIGCINGCTDPIALNYDSLAYSDDGSCEFVEGCTDIYALNYDSLAYITNNELCEYPACDGLDTFTADQTCLPNGQTLVQFFWSLDQNNGNCTPTKFWYSNANNPNPSQYMLNPNAQDFAVFAGNGQMPPNWSVEHYGWVEFVDGSFSDTITYIPSSCIAGCTDPTQSTFNPWATFDDGSCSGTNCDQATTYQITMDITFDNWPGETSWSLTSGELGIIQEELPGTYNFNDIGQTYTYNFCVDQEAGFELIVNDTYGDGLAGSTSGGSMDGMITIYDCEGDTIWNMDNPGFGDVLYSGTQFGIECELAESVLGCTDDDYQQFNPLATDDDGSCTDLHVYGCTDPSAFNYDPDASINDIVPDCQYQLWIGDAGGDGWGNSYIGVYQNGVNFGTFTMGPGSYQDSFLLVLDAGIPVNVYYFEVGGPQQPPEEVQFQTWHNSFKLTNADGVVLLHEGTNPFANNGLGALQSFKSPFWTTYSSIPYCGDYCIPKVVGCTDPTAFNYNPEANTDSGCIPIVLGCTNEIAFNYNPQANTDDDSCVPEIIGCTDEEAFNYNEEANVNDEASCIPVILGCMDDGKFNFNPAANTDDGSCIPFVYGCTDINAFNFDVNANTDIGNCIPVVLGCTDPSAFNYNVNANTDDGGCVDVVIGCTDATALNYNVLANTNNGCIYPVLGCTDIDAFNFDPLANTNDGSCVDFIYGCTDPTQFNYDINANTDNGSCIPYIYGCTDSTAFNYSINANTDNGTCIPCIFGCINPVSLNYDPLANTDDGSCIPFIYGCTDSTQFNYNPLANTDNGSCIPFIYGCTDASAFNYDPLANTNDNSCCLIAGCTDPLAVNYNEFACFDDNSCITAVPGCTDVSAYNYNPAANISDSTACLYDAGCYGGPGVPYWLNDECFAWVIDVDNYCCDNDWDPTCQSMYDYCQLGWPTDIADVATLGIAVYPNPTRNVLTIDTRLDIKVELYDLMGRLLINSTETRRLDLSDLPNGLYNLSIIHENKRYSKQIVKQ